MSRRACDRPAPIPPSAWVVAHADMVPRGGSVLDVAAGAGPNARLFLDRGHPVTAVDVDTARLPDHARLTVVEADLEGGHPWPLPSRRFAGVVVTRYLHRPLLPTLVQAVAPGGVLLYETFLAGHEVVAARPSNPDFLLAPGELRAAARDGGLVVVAEEEGHVTLPGNRPAVMGRIAAVRPGAAVVCTCGRRTGRERNTAVPARVGPPTQP